MSYHYENSGFPSVADVYFEQRSIVEAIASWCEALHGTAVLQTALRALAEGLGASAAMIVRTQLADGRQQRVATYEAGEESACRAPLRLSFADIAFGPDLLRARPGTIWLSSACADRADPVLAEFQQARRLAEFCVLILAAGPGQRDHVELHFSRRVSPAAQAALGAVVPTMARTWATRQVGVVTRTIMQQRPAGTRAHQADPGRPLLSVANPAQLSRAEFRVCLLLGRGLSVGGAAKELGVSAATIRTHLRNIYAKTETGSLAELVFRLVGPGQGAAPVALRRSA